MRKGVMIASALTSSAIGAGLYAGYVEKTDSFEHEMRAQEQTVTELARLHEDAQGMVGVLVSKLYEADELGICAANFMAEETAVPDKGTWTTEQILQVPGCEDASDSVLIAARNVDDERDTARAILSDYTAEAIILHDMTPQTRDEKIGKHAAMFGLLAVFAAASYGIKGVGEYLADRRTAKKS